MLIVLWEEVSYLLRLFLGEVLLMVIVLLLHPLELNLILGSRVEVACVLERLGADAAPHELAWLLKVIRILFIDGPFRDIEESSIWVLYLFLIVLLALGDFLFQRHDLFFSLLQLLLQLMLDLFVVVILIVYDDLLNIALVWVNLLQFKDFYL
jgi:hypothetical protein